MAPSDEVAREQSVCLRRLHSKRSVAKLMPTDYIERRSLPLSIIFVAIVLQVVSLSSLSVAQGEEIDLLSAGAARNTTTPQVTFVENIGQWPDSILFRGEASGNVVWITATGWYIELQQAPVPARLGLATVADSGQTSPLQRQTADALSADSSTNESAGQGQLIGVRLEGANIHPEIVYGDKLPFTTNLFFGSDSSKWRHHIPMYSTINLLNIYNGIDLRFYGRDGQMEYDFLVSPGSDPSAIKIVFSGQECLDTTANGDLLVAGILDTVVQLKPVAFQLVGNQRESRDIHFVITEGGRVSFEFDNEIDLTKPVVIDPVITFSRYLGGSGVDEALAITVDDQECMYVTGTTKSLDFPATATYRDPYNNNLDVFVTKLSPEGDVIFSTLLGGSRDERAWAIELGPDGSVYITGTTFSWDYPIANELMNGEGYLKGDAFVTRLSPDGIELIFSTYLGGGLRDDGGDIAVDSLGAVIVVGTTASPEFPVTRGVDTTFNGALDIFVLKLSPNGDSLEFGTFWGGSNVEGEWVDYSQAHVAVDNQGFICVGSWTWSHDFPLINHVDSTVRGYTEACVVKFTPSVDSVIYSTLLGGDYFDRCSDIAVDRYGYVYVMGEVVDIGNFPRPGPSGVFQIYDVDPKTFLCRLSPQGAPLLTTILFGTNYFGDAESGRMALDRQNCINVVGSARSLAYLHKYSPKGAERLFAGYVGGTQGMSREEYGKAIALDSNGGVYLVGSTSSTNFPVTYEGSVLRGRSDAFVARIEEMPTDIVEVDAPSLPASIKLEQNYPNPFNAATTFDFSLPSREFVTVEIFNVLGQRVAMPVRSEFGAGTYKVMWKGTDDSGQEVASGVYLYRLTAGPTTETRKMILLK